MKPKAVFQWLSLVIVLAVLLAFAFLIIPSLFKAPEKTPEAAAERPDGPMLILVHGAASNPKRFDWLAARLAEAGWTAQRRFAYDCRDEWIEETAARLADFVVREAGQRRIVIIAHSMGGIISRYYVERLGGSVRTDALVLLGTPNRGTQSADAMRTMFKPDYLDSARIGGKPLDPAERILLRTMISSLKLEYGTKSSLQLTTDSPLIRELNSRPLPAGVRYIVVAGTSSAGGVLGHYQLLNDLRARLGLPMPDPNDGIVPLECATIPPELGKTELLTVDASHVELTFDNKVLERILALLDQITSPALPPEPRP
jgi:pimeloyl-ACP methyl ester carboxylesterase